MFFSENSGTYLLWLRLPEATVLQIGRLGEIAFQAGVYGYVGSAFGPGGIEARLRRHLKRTKRLRWHIDFLRLWAEPFEVWLSSERVEHFWAERLVHWRGSVPVARFGCSDCRCPSHLFYFQAVRPPASLFGEIEVRPLALGFDHRSGRSGSSHRDRSGSA